MWDTNYSVSPGEIECNQFDLYCEFHNCTQDWFFVNYLIETTEDNNEIIKTVALYLSQHPSFNNSNIDWSVKYKDDADYICGIIEYGWDYQLYDHDFLTEHEIWAEAEQSREFELNYI